MTRESDTFPKGEDENLASRVSEGSAAPSGVRPTSTTSTTSQHTDLISRLEAAFDAPCASYPDGRAFITVKVPDAHAIIASLSDLTTQRDALREALERLLEVHDALGAGQSPAAKHARTALTETPDAVG